MPRLLMIALWAALFLLPLPPVHGQPKDAPVLSHPLGSNSAPAAAAKGGAMDTPKGRFRDISWDDLVPADWDPYKGIKQLNLAGLSDADPRAEAAMKQLREAWNNAPANPAIEGQPVRLPGYIVPLEDGKGGMSEFLLVPYFGACIHTPPPPANQIVQVKPQQPVKGFRSMDTVWISGTLKPGRIDTMMGTSGYRMEAVKVEPYTGKGN